MSKATQEQQRAAVREEYAGMILSLAASGRLPYEDQAKAIMVDALMTETRDKAHAERAIRRAIDTGAPDGGWNLAELRAFIGAAREPDGAVANRDCPHCGGFGWETQCFLRTWDARSARWRSTRIERDQFDDLTRRKLDPNMQQLVEGARRCPAGCQPSSKGFTPEVTR